jgi:hypothetical protein
VTAPGVGVTASGVASLHGGDQGNWAVATATEVLGEAVAVAEELGEVASVGRRGTGNDDLARHGVNGEGGGVRRAWCVFKKENGT